MFRVRELRVVSDEFGPEHVYEVFDLSTDEAFGWVVVDNTLRSPTGTGKGGTAMYPYCDLEITLRKARVMTFKQVFCVPIGTNPKYQPWGGAKGGIGYDSSRPDAMLKLKQWARALYGAKVIPQRYVFGLDVGLTEKATRAVVEELGDPQVATGKPKDLGGIPYDELGIAGLGLLTALRPMCDYADISFQSQRTRIAIQGFGAVGSGFMRWLGFLPKHCRPRVVSISDVGGAVYREGGFDPEVSIETAQTTGSIVNYPGVDTLPLGEEKFLSVEILLLAYKEDQITGENVDRVRAPVVLQGANLGVTREAELALHGRGVVSIPDFVVNAGSSTVVYVEYAGGSVDEGILHVREVLSHNTRMILEKMKYSSLDPRTIAMSIAEDEIRNAKPPRHTEREILS